MSFPVAIRLQFPFYPSKNLVGAGRFELPTPGPPDRCANRAALRSASRNQIFNLHGFGNTDSKLPPIGLPSR